MNIGNPAVQEFGYFKQTISLLCLAIDFGLERDDYALVLFLQSFCGPLKSLHCFPS